MRRILFSVIVGIVVAGSGDVCAQTNVLRLDDETRSVLRSATEDKWFKMDVLFGTFVGGVVAIVAGLAANWDAHRRQAKHKRQEDDKFAANVLRAIRCELDALRAIYEKGIGEHLAKVVDGQILEIRLALTEDWFTVFTANAVHLGEIEDEISRRIVTTYGLMKSLIEEYRINNEYLAEWKGVEYTANTTTSRETLHARRDQLHQCLVLQAIRIKKSDAGLKVDVAELFGLLDKRGIK